MEYAIYPFDYMRITQRHDKGNHLPHWNNSKNYSDKPWDEAVFDGGRQYFTPKNDFIVEEVLIPPKLTNSVRLKSVNKLKTPYKEEKDYLYITLSHMNDETMRTLKKGQLIPKGSKVILEGNAPPSSGNHFHITANFGKYYGIKKNSNNVWCFTYEKSLLPNEAFYVDEKVNILNSSGYTFEQVPKKTILGHPVIKNIHKDQIEVLVTNLRGRDNPNGKIKGYVKVGVYDILESKKDGNYTWYKVGIDLWIAHSDAWSKLYLKEDIVEKEKEEEEINTEEANEDLKGQNETLKEIIDKIINFLKSVLKRKN